MKKVTKFNYTFFFVFTVPTQMVTQSRTVTTVQNQQVQIPCTARGIPRPTITWKRNGRVIRGRVTSKNTLDGHYLTRTITIPSVQTRDFGVYICTATNKVTRKAIKHQVTLVVQGIFVN